MRGSISPRVPLILTPKVGEMSEEVDVDAVADEAPRLRV